MSGGAELGFAAAVLAPVKDDGLEQLIKLVFFVAIFVGPAILKAIKESARKKAEQRERSAPRADASPPAAEAQASEGDAAPDPGGLENWERLMRGETETPPVPVVPPPLPPAPGLERAPRRRVLTETRALTEEQALTEAPPLTGGLPLTAATAEERSLEDPTGYDGSNQPKLGLGREFAGFAPQEGLASDREGGPTKRIGERPSFAGSEAFQSLSEAGAQSEVTAGAAPGRRSEAQELKPRSVARMRMTRAQLRRTMQLAEILGPPVGVRPLESGPTRPLGWS